MTRQRFPKHECHPLDLSLSLGLGTRESENELAFQNNFKGAMTMYNEIIKQENKIIQMINEGANKDEIEMEEIALEAMYDENETIRIYAS